MIYRNFTLALLAAASGLALSTEAQAQTSPAASEGGTISELVVTATKREERLQDVPLSVSDVSGNQLDQQNVATLTDLSRTTPSLNVSGGNLGIRGVSTNGFARSSESAVSVVLDGVVLDRALIDSLFDIARVEVLSGPQGMLFGKNASAGVISIVTNAPDPTKFEAIAHADLGNFQYDRDRLTVNIPVASNAALRIGAHYEHSGGFADDTFLNKEDVTSTWGARARFLWEPTSDLKINIIGDYEKDSGSGIAPQAYAIVPAGSLLATRLAACGIVASIHNDKNCANTDDPADARAADYGISGQVDYTLPGDFLITSITANRWRNSGPHFLDTTPGGDPDLLNVNIFDTNHIPFHTSTFSEELRLTSPSKQRLEYVAGLYFSATRSVDQILQAGTLGVVPLPLQIGRVNFVDVYQRSYAAFGQATFHVTDKLSFIFGGRYTDDFLKDNTLSLDNSTTPTLASLGYTLLPPFQLAPVHERVPTNNFSYRVGAQYEFTSDLMAYVTASRGYKGPAVNDQASPPIVNAIIRPEIPQYYEAGFKGVFLDGRLLTTLAVFHNHVKDFQTAVFTPPTAANPVPGFSQGNAPYIVSQGVEVDVTGRPIDGLSLNGGIIYNDAKYAPTFLVACGPAQLPGVGTCSAESTTSPVDQVAGTPKWRATFNGEYARDVASNLTAFIQSDLVFQTGVHASPTFDPIPEAVSQRDQWLLGARLGLRTTDGRLGISIWGRNLLNNYYYTLGSDPLAGFTGGGTGTYRINLSPDLHRTFGVTLDTHF